jgi:hypothetical protein
LLNFRKFSKELLLDVFNRGRLVVVLAFIFHDAFLYS